MSLSISFTRALLVFFNRYIQIYHAKNLLFAIEFERSLKTVWVYSFFFPTYCLKAFDKYYTHQLIVFHQSNVSSKLKFQTKVPSLIFLQLYICWLRVIFIFFFSFLFLVQIYIWTPSKFLSSFGRLLCTRHFFHLPLTLSRSLFFFFYPFCVLPVPYSKNLNIFPSSVSHFFFSVYLWSFCSFISLSICVVRWGCRKNIVILIYF